MPKELYRVFVDESGDRGSSPTSSDIFVLAAVIVRDADLPRVVAGLEDINAAMNKPPGTALHWAENIKTHQARKMVAKQLGTLPMTLTNVVVMKRSMGSPSSRLGDPTSMYNYAVRRLLERISWFVASRNGEAVVTFAHVRRFPYEKLEEYLARLKTQDTSINWASLTGKPRIDQPRRVPGLQVADLCAGCLWSALKPDRFGNYEQAYLREIYQLLYMRRGKKIQSYGMNIVGEKNCMSIYPWWPKFELACSKL
jgi:hypothetical protein